MKFKIIFPAGYRVKNVLNDNIDINIITQDGNVFFGTLFTQSNINYLMAKEEECYFWATDMVIAKDLRKATIIEAIRKIINEGYLDQAFSKIGTIEKVYPNHCSFDDIEDLNFE
jgi:hypothetical protein